MHFLGIFIHIFYEYNEILQFLYPLSQIKTYKYLTMFWLFVISYTAMTTAVAQDPNLPNKTELTVTGIVRDKDNRKKLENVAVSLIGYAICHQLPPSRPSRLCLVSGQSVYRPRKPCLHQGRVRT